MKKLLSILLLAACCVSVTSCGSREAELSKDQSSSLSVTDNKKESDGSDGTSLADIETLTDANGDTIHLTLTDEYQINGYYICSGDHSAWTFYDDLLSIASIPEDADTPECSLFELGFFEASEDAQGDKHLCIAVHNPLSDESSFWYVMNIQDEDGSFSGLELMLPGDPDSYIILLPKEGTEQGS